MRYIVDLNQNHVEDINSLINRGKYKSFAQFIATAVENQIYIERTELEAESILEAPDEGPTVEKGNFKKGDSVKVAPLDLTIPGTLPSAVGPPSFSELDCSLREIEEEKCWLWGQTNKIFPLKLGLRALLRSIDSTEWIDLEPYRNRAAEIAWSYGEKISSYERKGNKKRDEKISAGLPMGDEDYKSKMRYKGHFLAFMRKDAKLGGALPFLRFANLARKESGSVLIGLTEAGLHFACLENPVIDNTNFDRSLSEKEISYYLNHISENVSGEFAAIRWLLEKLADGITSREQINSALKKEFGLKWAASDAVINTQRAGLMARMVELGLIDRVRKGIRVFYYLSDSGKVFLNERITYGKTK